MPRFFMACISAVCLYPAKTRLENATPASLFLQDSGEADAEWMQPAWPVLHGNLNLTQCSLK